MFSNVQAEKEIIGIMLTDNKYIPMIQTHIDINDFTVYGNIFQDICKTFEEKNIVDLTNTKGDLEELMKCQDSVITTANWNDRCNKIKENSIKRQYLQKAKEVQKLLLEDENMTTLEAKENILNMFDMKIEAPQENKDHIKNILPGVIDDIEKACTDPGGINLSWGLKDLDKLTLGIHKEELTCIAARPGIGKTTFTLNTGLNLAMENKRVAMFSLEMSKEKLGQKIISNISGVNSYKLRAGTVSEDEWKSIAKSLSIADKELTIIDSCSCVEDIIIRIKQMHLNNPLDLIIIDYLQLMSTKEKHATNNDKFGAISRKLKLLTIELNIPVIILAQLNRDMEKNKRRPILSDLRDSGNLEQDMDNVFFLHDPNHHEENKEHNKLQEIEFIVGKQRAGQRDVIEKIGFKKHCSRFVDLYKGG